MTYLLVKWIHILSATILFGTGVGTAFHMFLANRSGNIAAIHNAARSTVLADYLFTAPAVIIQPVTGVWLMLLQGYEFSERWIAISLALYLLAGACWLPVVRIQIRMRDLARQALEADAPLPEGFRKLDRWWIALGAVAFPALLIVFYLMVFKPA